jgi:type IV pilus assembly protein PilA
MEKKIQNFKKGFTLLEMLLVVAIIAILAGIVIVAINPSKQLGAANDAKRWSDVNTIVNAVYQYSIDHGGVLPGPGTLQDTDTCTSTVSASEICLTGAVSCVAGAVTLTDLSSTTEDGTYISSIPVDPSGPTTPHTGYYVVHTLNGRVTVCAPSADAGIISVTK